MVLCGVRKFDKLPARVGMMDVDYLRFKLLDNQKKIEYLKTDNKLLIRELNEARKRWKNGRRKLI